LNGTLVNVSRVEVTDQVWHGKFQNRLSWLIELPASEKFSFNAAWLSRKDKIPLSAVSKLVTLCREA